MNPGTSSLSEFGHLPPNLAFVFSFLWDELIDYAVREELCPPRKNLNIPQYTLTVAMHGKDLSIIYVDLNQLGFSGQRLTVDLFMTSRPRVDVMGQLSYHHTMSHFHPEPSNQRQKKMMRYGRASYRLRGSLVDFRRYWPQHDGLLHDRVNGYLYRWMGFSSPPFLAEVSLFCMHELSGSYVLAENG
ncbi:hypothetical protein K435DRAFT_180266 [Dendrothele bispora CBS 962.96]|uniref:Uncharacterized protein n=1 Tax=Dendrothele bispora (strain CBS 962.96) TaxID=1314807 RepID=A0A4S8LW87_DENBC|nr:hypothetical protein K435DRAFT_180266 [Dendrothele bispora CBS 962.96]